MEAIKFHKVLPVPGMLPMVQLLPAVEPQSDDKTHGVVTSTAGVKFVAMFTGIFTAILKAKFGLRHLIWVRVWAEAAPFGGNSA